MRVFQSVSSSRGHRNDPSLQCDRTPNGTTAMHHLQFLPSDNNPFYEIYVALEIDVSTVAYLLNV